jgi:hypothetical protein
MEFRSETLSTHMSHDTCKEAALILVEASRIFQVPWDIYMGKTEGSNYGIGVFTVYLAADSSLSELVISLEGRPMG